MQGKIHVPNGTANELVLPASMQCLWGSHTLLKWLDVTVPLSGKSNILTICQNHPTTRVNKKVAILKAVPQANQS